VVRAVDFAQRNGDVFGWTVGRSERRGTEVPDRSGIAGCTNLSISRRNAVRDSVKFKKKQERWVL